VSEDFENENRHPERFGWITTRPVPREPRRFYFEVEIYLLVLDAKYLAQCHYKSVSFFFDWARGQNAAIDGNLADFQGTPV
jgi:hypothetical protein